MGRLFQYNRFSNKDKVTKGTAGAVGEPRERKMVRKSLRKSSIIIADKSNKYQKLICPTYTDLYPDHCENVSDSSSTCSRSNIHMQTSPLIIAMAAKGVSFATVKSVEVAVKKYSQWSSKLLANVSEDTESEDCSQLSSSSPTSGFHSFRTSSDDEMLTATETTTLSAKKCKLYECMKDFLRRKLFHQQQQQQQQHQYINTDSSVVVEVEVEDESTSDYYEADDDLLQSTSYCADGDDEDDDETYCCIDADSTDDDECLLTLTNDTISLTTSDRLASEANISSGSLNCFQYTAHVAADDTDFWDDSDVGISDCCQLLSDRSPKQNQKRTHPIEETEASEAPWYLPNIPAKSAIAQLAKENPGTFIVRQCGKDGSYFLYLRLESKVKKFVIIRSARCYKLKGAKKEFPSLKALVTHHSLMAEQLPLTLILPRPAELKSKSRRYPDDFDTFESLQLLGIFQLLQSEGTE